MQSEWTSEGGLSGRNMSGRNRREPIRYQSGAHAGVWNERVFGRRSPRERNPVRQFRYTNLGGIAGEITALVPNMGQELFLLYKACESAKHGASRSLYNKSKKSSSKTQSGRLPRSARKRLNAISKATGYHPPPFKQFRHERHICFQQKE